MKAIKILILFIFILSCSELSAQRRGENRGHGRRGNRVVVVKRSVYRPAKVVVYHPAWHPAYTYHRRWVYFPRYNFYWDNWRNQYVYYSGNAWIAGPTAPPAIVNVDLSKEKITELREDEDDNDDVYHMNDTHKTLYPAQ